MLARGCANFCIQLYKSIANLALVLDPSLYIISVVGNLEQVNKLADF